MNVEPSRRGADTNTYTPRAFGRTGIDVRVPEQRHRRVATAGPLPRDLHESQPIRGVLENERGTDLIGTRSDPIMTSHHQDSGRGVHFPRDATLRAGGLHLHRSD